MLSAKQLKHRSTLNYVKNNNFQRLLQPEVWVLAHNCLSLMTSLTMSQFFKEKVF